MGAAIPAHPADGPGGRHDAVVDARPPTRRTRYSANDASAGDLDGDGDYEIVLKWDPSNAKDNSQAGCTGNVYHRRATSSTARACGASISGPNIRAGAHYTQFIVLDFDGDGKAEMAVKTAPGTRDGTGAYLSMGPAASDTDTHDLPQRATATS